MKNKQLFKLKLRIILILVALIGLLIILTNCNSTRKTFNEVFSKYYVQMIDTACIDSLTKLQAKYLCKKLEIEFSTCQKFYKIKSYVRIGNEYKWYFRKKLYRIPINRTHLNMTNKKGKYYINYKFQKKVKPL